MQRLPLACHRARADPRPMPEAEGLSSRPPPMDHAAEPLEASAVSLILFTRHGCCLCEGLEERLRELGLSAEGSAPHLSRIDVDGNPELQSRYGLEVPVLAVRHAEAPWRELPRVPPRLSGERLAQWLARQGVAIPAADAG